MLKEVFFLFCNKVEEVTIVGSVPRVFLPWIGSPSSRYKKDKKAQRNQKSRVAVFALSSARLRPIGAAFTLNVRVVFMLHTSFHAAAPQRGGGGGVLL